MSAGTLGGLINVLGQLLSRRANRTVTGEATTGGDGDDDDPGSPIAWETVVFAAGSIEASLIAGRLQSEGIPARIQQEAAGAALGLTVGLGSIRVMVPEDMLEDALAVLDMDFEVYLDMDADEMADDEFWSD